MYAAHRPGIVALRPLQLGDILDGAVRAVRANPKSMIGMAFLVTLVTTVPSAVLSLLLTRAALGSEGLFAQQPQLTTLGAALPPLVIATLTSTVLGGLLVYVVSEAVLGHHPSLGGTWQAVRSRLLPLVCATLAIALVALLPFLLVGGLVYAVWALSGSVLASVLLAVLGVLADVVFDVWLYVRTMLVAPVVVLERQGLRTAVRRSFALSRGGFWRLLGISALAGVLAALAAYLLALPFSAATVAVTLVRQDDPQLIMTASVLAQHLGRLVSSAVVGPFSAGVVCLLYVDRRIRLEALDVLLIRAAQADAAPGA